MLTMRFRWVWLQLSAGLALGCGEPQPSIESVVPIAAGSDRDVRLTILGRDFVPATILDPVSGRRIATSEGFAARIGMEDRWVHLSKLDWLSSGALAGTLPANSAETGWLDVEVTDPRGRVDRLEKGFHELGRDTEGPTLSFLGPAADTLFAAGMLLRGSFRATDAPPGTLEALRWTAYANGSELTAAECRISPKARQADCGFQLVISDNLRGDDEVSIVAEAEDDSGNASQLTLPFSLRDKPKVSSIFPKTGGTAGGTDVVIRGTGFLPGSTALLGDQPLLPDGGIRIDDTSISGYTPPHAEGSPSVVVHTPIGDASGLVVFRYEAPPVLVSITPEHGPPSGGTEVAIRGANFSSDTRIYFGSTLDDAVPLDELLVQGPTSIIGITPAGSGTTTVWAFDGSLGLAKLPDGFTWRAP